MVNIKIDDINIKADKDKTVLEVARENNITIPTLCYLKKQNEIASCRICVVEIKGNKSLVPACVTKISEGMEITSNSKRVLESRKTNLELIISNHNKDCGACFRNKKCELQLLATEYKVNEDRFGKLKEFVQIDEKSPYMIRDNNKCILCGKCASVCKKTQEIGIIGKNYRGVKTKLGCAFDESIDDTSCILCGQCIMACPTGALIEKNNINLVNNAIEDKNKHVVVCVAPAVRASLGEEFGFPVGTNVKDKMVGSLKEVGVDKVFDVSFAADLTVMEESYEFIKRLENKQNIPMFTSCCPAWVKFVEKYYPEMTSNLSSCKSPNQMLGATIKNYYAIKKDIDPKDVFVASVMPCLSKKYEKDRGFPNEVDYKDVDVVITVRELAKMIKQKGIDFNNVDAADFDIPFSTGASTIFGNSGGVMSAVLRTGVETLTDKKLVKLEFDEIMITKGIKEVNYKLEEKIIKVAVVSGIKNAKTVIEKIKNKECEYHLIEFMACPGGCINGGGQPIVPSDIRNFTNFLELRKNAIEEEDKNLSIRKAHENPFIKELYDNYLKTPGSEESCRILHTKHKKD